MSNTTLFKHSNIPGGGMWITEGIERGIIVTAHDDSYQPDLDATVCSAALVILCTHTGKIGVVSAAEKTNAQTASNYRGEGLISPRHTKRLSVSVRLVSENQVLVEAIHTPHVMCLTPSMDISERQSPSEEGKRTHVRRSRESARSD